MRQEPGSLTLQALELRRRFGERTVVNGVNLELRRGEVLGLLGPNGAGKSTTLRMLTGNLALSDGSVSICGVNLLKQPKSAKSQLGYLPEIPPLYRDLTVDEYLALAGKLRRIEKSKRSAAIERAKQRCQLSDVGRRLIGRLSRGFQQRVGIAQAIIHDPEVVILDEPTVGLDPNQIRDIRGVIRELGNHHSVILSTHILQEVEAVCDRVEIMHEGAIVYSDTLNRAVNFDNSTSIVVGMEQPPEVEEISAIPGVTKVVSMAENLLRVYFTAERNPTSELVARSVRNEWKLYQLSAGKSSLEDLFVQFTQPNRVT